MEKPTKPEPQLIVEEIDMLANILSILKPKKP